MGRTKKKQMKKAAMVKEQSEDEDTREDPKMEQIRQKKQQKTKAKTQYTRIKNQLLRMLESDTFSREDVNGAREKFSHAQEETSNLLLELSDLHEEMNNIELSNKITEELEKLNEEFTETDNRVQEVLDALREEMSSQYSKRSRKSRFTVRSQISGHSQRSNKVEKDEQADIEERRSHAASKDGERIDFKTEVQQIDDEKLALEREYQRQQQLLDKRMEEVEIASNNNRNSRRRDDACRPPSKQDDVMKWISDIPVENNHNGEDRMRRSWDQDGDTMKHEGQADVTATKKDYGYRGEQDGDGRFGMIKHIEEEAVNEETKSLRSHNARWVPGDVDQSRRMAGNGNEFARGSINKNHQREESRETSKDIKYELGNDMWKQLRRVSIPVFCGDKRTYNSWKTAFMTCVDQAPATPEYKLLQLRSYLKGEALKVVESLGHSAVAYEAAKERLERKYGGIRRQIAINMEEIDQFKPIRPGYARDVEKLADLLDILTINLKEAKRTEELGNGSLYLKVQKKLTERMVADYQRWIFEKRKNENVESLREWLLRETEFLTVASETIKGLGPRSRELHQQTHYGENFSNKNNKIKQKCPVCTESHPVWRCNQFKVMDTKSRWQTAKKCKLCYRCLCSNHRGNNCNQLGKCGINGCTETHNRLLHDNEKKEDKTQEDNKKADSGKSDQRNNAVSPDGNDHNQHCNTSMKLERVSVMALRTVPVKLKNGNKELIVNALLDDASTTSYINYDVAAELGLQGPLETVSISTMNGNVKTYQTMPVVCELLSCDGTSKHSVSAYTTNKVTGNMRPIEWRVNAKEWPHLRNIKFPKLGPRAIIDILIGADHPHLHRALEEINGKSGEPIARKTPLGWTCIGPLRPKGIDEDYNLVNHSWTHFTRSNKTAEDTSQILERFWEIDTTGLPTEKARYNEDETNILEMVKKSMQFKDGRYEVSMPWKSDPEKLPENYASAYKRLMSTEKKLMRNKEQEETYKNIIDSYLKKGYIRRVSNQENEKRWYLPHFAVEKPEKETTKTRIVFDASAKENGVSLNDIIHCGPKLQRDLCEVLLRFRKNPVALVCDISEMYLQIGLAAKDRKYHSFLWRDMDLSRLPDILEFTRLFFGVNACPFLAQNVSQNHAEKNKMIVPRAAETVLKSTYMDDSMDSVVNEDAAIQLYKDLTMLWESAGMHPRKWISNSAEVMEQIPIDDRAAKVNLLEEHLPKVKTLGVQWFPEEDQFSFEVSPHQYDGNLITKRSVLSRIATLFDPLGFLAPYCVRGKVLLQEIWLSGLSWDEPLDMDLLKKFKAWNNELNQISKIKVPRCLQEDQQPKDISLHFFSDASVDAYAAVVYQRTQYNNDNVSVRLVAAKTKVAPLQATSIPRLELMGALLSTNLSESIRNSLQIPKENIYFWSDSMNVLWWLKNRSRALKTFVGNRVARIQQKTSPEQWKYVQSKENPADLPTRGLTATELDSSELWWKGPTFLYKEKSEWKKADIISTEDASKELSKKTIGKLRWGTEVTLHIMTEKKEHWRLSPRRFSTWQRLKRVQAWVNRFLHNCREQEKKNSGELKVEELQDAENYIIREMQQQCFREEYKALHSKKTISKQSKLLALNPFLSDDGIIRSNSRLKHAEYLSFDARNPVILPRGDWVTKLIVRFYHEKDGHASGTNHTLARISKHYWVTQAREEIRQVESECYKCKIRKAKAADQVMAPLPKFRLSLPLRAFSRDAVDFAGPYLTMQGRGRKRQKRYLCLFTCMVSRAVHLEMAYGLDTDSFLNAFSRMVNRRGVPEEVVSDNGTNFISGERELRELVEALDKEKICKSAADKGIKWHFNPPLAPHFGGIHESMVKSAKRAIKAVLGNADVSDEELTTIFIGVENFLNSRPLTYQTANPEDNLPLTPNHFLYGQQGGTFAPSSVDETPFSHKKRWRRIQELIRHVWQRWIRELLPTLGKRTKWYQEKKNLAVGDIVLVTSPSTPRGSWPLGRVINTYPGDDGHVRAVRIKCNDKEYVRPINRLCPIDVFIDDETKKDNEPNVHCEGGECSEEK